MIVYIDSNILFSDPYLFSSRSQAILEKISVSKGKLKIPFVVYEETINNLVQEVSETKKSLLRSVNDLSKKLNRSGVLDSMVIPSFTEEKIRISYKQRYQDLIDAGLVEIIDHKSMNPEELIEDLLHRALNYIKPFGVKKEEFKDTVIWKTIVSDILHQEYDYCIFLSNNTSDFYNEDKSSLHDDLMKDVPTTVNLKTYKSMNDLLGSDEFTSQQQVLNSSINVTRNRLTKLEVLTSKIDKDYLLNKLRYEYREDVQTEIQIFFDHLHSHSTEQINDYFPLIDLDRTRYLKMRMESNYFMQQVNLEISEINEIDIIVGELTNKEDVIIVCNLIVIPKLKIFEEIYSSWELERAKLNIKISFVINSEEKLYEFDMSSCYPINHNESP